MLRSVRRGPLPTLAVVLTVLLGLTACTTTVSGSGQARLPSVADVTTSEQLATLLVSPPPDSEAGTTDWAKERTPTIEQLAEQTYKDPEGGAKVLEGYEIKGIAHVRWNVGDNRGCDMLLLLFDTPDKAENWKTQEVDAFGTEGLEERSLDAGKDTVGFSFDPDSDDITDTRFHTVAGRIGVLMDYFTTGTYDDTLANTWLTQQYDRLT